MVSHLIVDQVLASSILVLVAGSGAAEMHSCRIETADKLKYFIDYRVGESPACL